MRGNQLDATDEATTKVRQKGGRRPEDFFTHRDVELELAKAREEQRGPRLSRRSMIGGDFSGIDFTSKYESEFGPHTAEILGADFRNAGLEDCNLRARTLPQPIFAEPIFLGRTCCRVPISHVVFVPRIINLQRRICQLFVS